MFYNLQWQSKLVVNKYFEDIFCGITLTILPLIYHDNAIVKKTDKETQIWDCFTAKFEVGHIHHIKTLWIRKCIYRDKLYFKSLSLFFNDTIR